MDYPALTTTLVETNTPPIRQITAVSNERNNQTCSDAVLQSLAAVSQNLVQPHVIFADRKHVRENSSQLSGMMKLHHGRLGVIGYPDVVEQYGDHVVQERFGLFCSHHQSRF